VIDVWSFLTNITPTRDIIFYVDLTHLAIHFFYSTPFTFKHLNVLLDYFSCHIFEGKNFSFRYWHVAREAALNYSCRIAEDAV
jgi:hypothetical protein